MRLPFIHRAPRRTAAASRAVRAAALVTLLLAVRPSSAVTLPQGFQETVVLSGLSQPTAVRFAPDGRVFVAEKSGLIKVFDDLADPTPTVFADLRTNVYNFWDRGLLGLALDPAFPTQPYVYVLYTLDALPGGTPPLWGQPGQTSDGCPESPGATGEGCQVGGRLSRLTASGNVMTGAEQVLLEGWCQQYPSHSIGALAFGAEGALYVTGGDGASFNWVDYGQRGIPLNPCGDPPAGVGTALAPPSAEGGALRSLDVLTAGDPVTYDGALLRVDPATGAAWPTNPLVGGVPGDDAVLAYGLRNPFRFALRPGTREAWIGDVGWNTWEEINRVRDADDLVVENFGWPCYEGGSGTSLKQPGYDGANLTLCEGLYNGTIASALTAPTYGYDHGAKVVNGESCGSGSSSVTGLAFYTATRYPSSYQGALFFADYARSCIWAMLPGLDGAPDPTRRVTFGAGAPTPVDLQIGPQGDLFYVDLSGGGVRRVQYFRTNQPPIAVVAASPTSGAAPLTVTLDGSDSYDPDPQDGVTYAWDLDGDGQYDDATVATLVYVFTSTGTHVVRLRVTDGLGVSAGAEVVVTVENAPPVAAITAPSPQTEWRVGDTLVFAGEAVDPDEGTLPAAALSWSFVLHHCESEGPESCHEHQLEQFTGVAGGEFPAPDHEYPSWLELRLTAADSGVGDWWDAGWGVRRKLTLDNSAQTQTLADVPVLIVLDPTRIDYDSTRDGGEDLRFVDAAGTQLAHEIERWDETGVSYVWVKVPSIITPPATNVLWMYYDNPSAADGQQQAAVWDASYVGVWHLAGDLVDASARANDGVSHGATAAAGWIAGARSFDGNDWIDVGSDQSLALTGALTIEAWVRVANPNQSLAMRVLDKKTVWNGTAGFNLEYQPFANTVTTLGSGDNYSRANNVNLDTGWHYLASVVNGTTGALYVDGANATSDSSVSALAASSQPLNIGRRSGDGDYWNGGIDEVRLSRTARPASWIATQYLSMVDALVTYGPEEGVGVLTGGDSMLLFPATVMQRFQTTPAGLALTVGSASQTAPFEREMIVNSFTSVSAASPQSVAGTDYNFTSWSDAGAQAHDITIAAAAQPLTATFTGTSACTGVTTIPAAGGTVVGTTAGASTLAGTCGQTGMAPEEVFQWTPAVSGTATIATCGAGTGFDTVLYLRSGTCESGTQLACNDDACANGTGLNRASRITRAVTAGQTYFIVVDGFNGASGSFTLTVTPPAVPTPTPTVTPPPGTGACGSVTTIAPAGGTVTGTTAGASTLTGTCGQSGVAPEQVFQWTPAKSGTATIATCGAATAFDTVLYMRSGSCQSGTQLACNDDACTNATGLNRASRLVRTVTAGQTYFIVVDGFNGAHGSFALTVTPPP